MSTTVNILLVVIKFANLQINGEIWKYGKWSYNREPSL